MDFSDIRTIIIGEAGEYGKRLVRYLEIHLSSAVRVYHFTTAEGMVSFKEEAEIYLLDERFFKELSEEKQKFLKQKKLILLTWREEQGSFCKYDNPQKLLDMLSDFTDYNSDLSDLAAELKDTPTKLTIVYSPVYDEYLEQIARSFMSLGDVYMGAEDLGYKGIDSEYGEGGDMGDLCYYIHLREENILDILQDMLIPKEEVQVLHSAELQLFHVENLVRLETRNANMEGENEITMQDLIKASLRMRPDRIIVGEVRGAEAMSMLQALSTGHSGSVSSIHANSCRDALRRLETMVLMGMDMPLAAIQGLIASSVDILIHLGRLTTGKRKILEICEIKDYSRAEYDIRTLFQYKAGQTESLEMTGKLFHTEKLKSYGQYENYCEAVRLFCEEKREG